MRKKNLSNYLFMIGLFIFACLVMNFNLERVKAGYACASTCSCTCISDSGYSYPSVGNKTKSECESACRQACSYPYAYSTYSWGGCTCNSGTYLSGDTCVDCPRGYTSNAGAVGDTQCYITCSANTYMEFATASACSACPSGQTSSSHKVYYRNTSSCSGTTTKPKAVITCVSGVTYTGAAQVIATCTGGQISDEGFGPGKGKAVGSITFSCTGDSEHSDANQKACSIGEGTATHTCDHAGYYPDTEDNLNDIICKISCPAGKHVAEKNGQCVQCEGNTISSSHRVIEGYTSNCTQCTGSKACANSDHTECVACGHDPDPGGTSYTITANANGGTITTTTGWTNASDNKTATKSVTSGSTIGTLPTVTRSGYTLKEWRTKADGTGDVVTSSTTATANMTIYAIWTENTTTTSYTITANANGGKMEIYGDQTGGADSTTNTAGFILYPNAMPGVEYTITMSSATLTSGSATKFSTRCYDLTSDVTLSRKDVSFGSNISYTITCPSTANAEHQLVIPIYYGEAGATAGNHVTFSNIKIAVNTGWTNVSGNLTATKSISSGSTYGTLPIAVRPGYTLKEWNTKSDGTGTKVTSSITATANATIYAIWTKTSPDAPTPPSSTTSYQISFDCNGGTGSMSPMSVNFGQTVTLIANACVRTGYTFTGWTGYIGGTPIDGGTYSDGDSFDYTFESDMILKAQWNSNSGTSGTYLIHYDANGGTGTMADTEATVDVTGSLRANAFKYSGHTFDGWRAYYVDSDGNLVPLKDSSNNEVELKNKASFKNLYGPNGEEVTLYAQWKVVNPSTGIFVPTVIIGGLLLISAFGYYLVKKKNVVLE